MNKRACILAIETATESCSVALSDQGKVYQRQRVAPKEHNNLILPMVQSLLNEGNLGLEQLDAISVSIGPGSFVGTRLGVSVAKSLAYAANVPIFGFTTLNVLALSVAIEHTNRGLIIPILDAQLGGVYWAKYKRSEGKTVGLIEEQGACLSTTEDFIAQANPHALAAGPYLPKALSLEQLQEMQWLGGMYPNAHALLQLTQQAIDSGATGSNALEIEPLYLRHQVVEPKKQPVLA